jgi:TonB family protein
MKLPKDQPFWTSVILHLVVMLGLFLGTIVQAFKPKEKEHVFEMVEPPSEVSDASSSAPQPELPSDLPVVDLQPVPQVDIPAPLPEPPPEPTPVKTVEPTPSEPKLISAADFFKNHPKEDPKPRTPAPTPRKNISVPQIDVPQLIVPRSSNTNHSSQQLSSQQLSALSSYSARLRSKIDAAWTKPAHLAGVSLVAEVVFDVSATGRISNVRLSPGSGNAAFDQSVLAAFRKSASAGPTPTGQAHSFSLPFRMRD